MNLRLFTNSTSGLPFVFSLPFGVDDSVLYDSVELYASEYFRRSLKYPKNYVQQKRLILQINCTIIKKSITESCQSFMFEVVLNPHTI